MQASAAGGPDRYGAEINCWKGTWREGMGERVMIAVLAALLHDLGKFW